MSAPDVLSGLSAVAHRYDVLLCDVWGVVHNGRVPYPAAVEALEAFGARGGSVVLISNAPRPSTGLLGQLEQIGVARGCWQAFVTSGDATAAEIVKRAPGPAWAVGPDRDSPIYEGTGVTVTDRSEDAAFIVCTGLFDDEADQPEDYREAFKACAGRGLEMVCANPDRVVHRGEHLIWCAGALADVYAALGGTVVMAGKPYGPVYDLALREADRLVGKTVDRRRVLCIGDAVPTDVLGANGQDIDCLFVTGGIHGAELKDDHGQLDPERAEAMLGTAGAHARYVMQELSW